MSTKDLNAVLAKAEDYLQRTNPAFDMTNVEREEASEYAAILCMTIEKHRADSRKLLESILAINEQKQELAHQRMRMLHYGEGLYPIIDDDEEDPEGNIAWQISKEIERTLRIHQLHEAVERACLELIEERSTFKDRIADVWQKIVALMPWNRNRSRKQ